MRADSPVSRADANSCPVRDLADSEHRRRAPGLRAAPFPRTRPPHRRWRPAGRPQRERDRVGMGERLGGGGLAAAGTGSLIRWYAGLGFVPADAFIDLAMLAPLVRAP